MKIDSEFDKHLEVNKITPKEIRNAAICVNETLNLAWLSAQAIFEDKAVPELAFEIYELIQKRQRFVKATLLGHISRSG